MAGRRREAFEAQHADRGFRAHSAVVGLSGVGLGDGGQCPGPGVLEEVWIRDRAERAYSSDDAENRRQRHFSYGSFNRVSAATARQSGFAGTDESASRPTQERPGNYGRQLRSRATRAGSRGFFARVSENFLNREIKSNLKKRRKNMRRSASIASLATALVLGMGALGAGQQRFELIAQ